MLHVVPSSLREGDHVLAVEISYAPQLAGGARGTFAAENAPELHVYLSAGASVVDVADGDDTGVVIVNSTALADVGRRILVHVPFPDARARAWPVDLTLWFAVWIETSTRAGNDVVRARAGEAGVHVTHVLRARKSDDADDDVLVEYQTSGTTPLAKGVVTVHRAFVGRRRGAVTRPYRADTWSLRVDARVPPVFPDRGGDARVLAAVRANAAALATEVDGAFAMYAAGGLLERSEPSFVRGMHCYAYNTPVGDLPDGAFVRHVSRRPSPLAHYEACVEAALFGNDARAEHLLAAVAAQRRAPDALLPSMWLVGKVLAESLAVFPTALAYLDDFTHERRQRRAVSRAHLQHAAFSGALIGRKPTTALAYLQAQIDAGTLEGQLASRLLAEHKATLSDASSRTTYTLFMPTRLTTPVCDLPAAPFVVVGRKLTPAELESASDVAEWRGADGEPVDYARLLMTTRELVFKRNKWSIRLGGKTFDVQRKPDVVADTFVVYKLQETSVTNPRVIAQASGAPLTLADVVDDDSVEISEDFKLAREGNAGDCEDVGVEATAAAFDFTRLADDAAVRAAATPLTRFFLELLASGGPYLAVLPRGAVTQATLNTAVDGLADGDAKLHTFAALLPTTTVATRLAGPYAAAARASAAFARVNTFAPWQRALPTFVVEGTAYTSAIMRPLDHLYTADAAALATAVATRERVLAALAALVAAGLPSEVHTPVSPTAERDVDGAIAAGRADVSRFYKAVSSVSIAATDDVGVSTLAFARKHGDGSFTHGATFTAFTASPWPADVRLVPTTVFSTRARAIVDASLDHLEPVEPLSVEGAATGVRDVFGAPLREMFARAKPPVPASASLVDAPTVLPPPPACIVLAVGDGVALRVRDAVMAAIAQTRAHFTNADVRTIYLADPERDEHELPPVVQHYIRLYVATAATSRRS